MLWIISKRWSDLFRNVVHVTVRSSEAREKSIWCLSKKCSHLPAPLIEVRKINHVCFIHTHMRTLTLWWILVRSNKSNWQWCQRKTPKPGVSQPRLSAVEISSHSQQTLKLVKIQSPNLLVRSSVISVTQLAQIDLQRKRKSAFKCLQMYFRPSTNCALFVSALSHLYQVSFVTNLTI